MNEFFDHKAAASHHDAEGQHPADVTHRGADESYAPWAGGMDQRGVHPRGEGELPAKRERLFPRKVLIGWALVTLAAYLTFRLVGTVIKDVVRESVAASTQDAGSNSDGRVIIMLPNGKRITIRNDHPDEVPPKVPTATTAPATGEALPAPKAAPTAPEPKAPKASTQPARK